MEKNRSRKSRDTVPLKGGITHTPFNPTNWLYSRKRTLDSGTGCEYIMKPEVSQPSDSHHHHPISQQLFFRINDDLRFVLLVFISPWADKEILLLVAIIPFSFWVLCSTLFILVASATLFVYFLYFFLQYIRCIHSPRVHSCFLIALRSVKGLPGVPSRDSNSGLQYTKLTHYTFWAATAPLCRLF